MCIIVLKVLKKKCHGFIYIFVSIIYNYVTCEQCVLQLSLSTGYINILMLNWLLQSEPWYEDSFN